MLCSMLVEKSLASTVKRTSQQTQFAVLFEYTFLPSDRTALQPREKRQERKERYIGFKRLELWLRARIKITFSKVSAHLTFYF